jgi:hypothetical protein
MCFVFINENRVKKTVEIVLSRGGGGMGKKEGESGSN